MRRLLQCISNSWECSEGDNLQLHWHQTIGLCHGLKTLPDVGLSLMLTSETTSNMRLFAAATLRPTGDLHSP